MNEPLVQVLGAVAYGELEAYEGAKAEAEATPDEATRRRLRKVAAEELRHHKGFVARLEAMDADPERAMRTYRTALDRYHGHEVSNPVEDAMFGYLGEGVADDLLTWLRRVVDPETAAFIDTVIGDEIEHEAAAADELRTVLEGEPHGRALAARAARRMVGHALERAQPRAAHGRLPPPRPSPRAPGCAGRRPRAPHAGRRPRAPRGSGAMRVDERVDIDAFREQGFFVVPRLFDAGECDEIVAHVERAALKLALGETDDGPLSYGDEGVAVPVQRGDVLVFSSLIMHRSGPNTTERHRRAWIIQYCSGGARSALSGKLLDDRLLVACDGAWLDEPVRQREFDLVSVLANYDNR